MSEGKCTDGFFAFSFPVIVAVKVCLIIRITTRVQLWADI